MLSMSNLSAAQAEHYYAKDDYYTQKQAEHDDPHQSTAQVGATWYGRGAAALGLAEVVDPLVFQKLLHGKTPQGKSLHAKRINLDKHRAATDYTFSAPKSVSIAALVQQDVRVIQAHDQAVKVALSVLEQRYAKTRITTAQGRQRVTTGNVVAAVFRHETSREQDPQLHSHCVVVNATQLADGSWRSFSNEAIVAYQKLLGEIYQNELAYQLRQFGYGTEPRANGQFELQGYAPELLNVFSTRTQQIQAYLEQWQQQIQADAGTPLEIQQRKQATLNTRRHKQVVPHEVLLEAWQQQIRLHQLQLPALPSQTSDLNEADFLSFQAAVSKGIEHAAEREAVFGKSKVERFVLEHHLGQQPFEILQQTIQSHPELMVADAAEDKYTTWTAIERELDTIRLMQQGKAAVKPIASPTEVEQWLNSTMLLTNGQRQVITLAATTTDQIIAWQGVAGAGKTASLRLYKKLAAAQGFAVRGFAPTAEAAKQLGDETGMPSDTVASLLYSQTIANQTQLPGKEIWVVDEASLLGAKDAQVLLQLAQQQQARVILVGDTRQLSAVTAGNPFKSLQAGGMATARLDESLRQQTQELKTAVALIAQDNVVEGIQALDQAGCITEIADSDQRLNQLIEDYLKLSPAERSQTLLLANTNQQRLELTHRIRQSLQTEGTLDSNAFTLTGLRSKNLTIAQACYVGKYEISDVLVPNQDYKKQGLTKNQQYTVLAIERTSNQLTVETVTGHLLTLDPAQCPNKTVYQPQPMQVAAGDCLKWTKNNRAAGIRNGQTFTLHQLQLDSTAQIIDSQGKPSQIKLSGKQYLDYALVSTTYSSQGKSANRVLALMDGTTSRESFYVAVSRAKQQLTLYINNKAELAKQAQRSRAKDNVSDYIPLLQVVNANGQTSQTKTQSASFQDYDFARGFGERVGNRVSQQLAAHLQPACYPAPADSLSQTADPAVAADHSAFAAGLEPYVEPLSSAIAEWVAERDFCACTGELAGAVAAVNQSLESLECAAQSRAELAAAVARLDAAVGAKTRNSQSVQPPDSIQLQPGALDTGSDRIEQETSKPNDTSLQRHEYYQRLWQRYSQGIRAKNLVQQDGEVAKRAFADGQSQREIALMLTVGSAYVQQLHQRQGKEMARDYVNQTAKAACHKVQMQKSLRKQQEQEL